MIKIIADSGCDIRHLTQKITKENVIYTQIPLTITIGEQDYIDTEDINISEMLETMEAYKGKTSTACPSPQSWLTAMEDADEIFIVTLTSGLSGSYNSAQTAKRMALEENPNRKIYVIDSLSASSGCSIIVEKLVEFVEKDLDFSQICEEIEKYKKHTKLAFILNSIDNFIKNGRAPRIAGIATNVLGISLIGRASEKGTLQPINKARGYQKAIKAIINEMQENGFSGGKIIVTHCDNDILATSFIEKIKSIYPNVCINKLKTSALCSYYAERKGLLIGYEC